MERDFRTTVHQNTLGPLEEEAVSCKASLTWQNASSLSWAQISESTGENSLHYSPKLQVCTTTVAVQ